MSHRTLSTTAFFRKALLDTINSDKDTESLSFVGGDYDFTLLDRPVVRIFPVDRSVAQGGARGMGGQSFQHKYKNTQTWGIGLVFPKHSQDEDDPEIWHYEDVIENLLIDHQTDPIGHEDIPDDIEWIQMNIVNMDYQPDPERMLILDMLTFEVAIHFAKVRKVEVQGASK